MLSAQVLLFLWLSKLETIEDNCNVLGLTKRSFLLSLLTLESIAAATQRSNTVLTFWPLEALVVSQPAAPSLSHTRQVRLMSSRPASSLRVWASTIGAPVLLRTWLMRWTISKLIWYSVSTLHQQWRWESSGQRLPPWPRHPGWWGHPRCSRGAPRSTPSRRAAWGWCSSGDLETQILDSGEDLLG